MIFCKEVSRDAPAQYCLTDTYFRLDVSQHMSLCRHYVRELRRSALVDTPELEKSFSKRSSAVLEGEDLAGPSTEKGTADQHLSAFLRSDSGTSRISPSNSHGESDSNQTTPASERPPPRPAVMNSNSGSSPMTQQNSGSNQNSHSPGTDSNSPAHTVARADIRASAEKILYTYLLPGSEREIILPQGILNEVTRAIEEEGRDDPEVFDAAKDYVFQAMERDAFPGFLRSKALGNIVPPSMMVRLIVGLLSMFGAFWTAFVLIFLDYSRRTRCWVCARTFILSLSTAQIVLMPFLVDPALHRRRLRLGIPSVHARSDSGACRIQRVHVHVILTHTRAFRSQTARQARVDGASCGRAHRCCVVLSVYFGAWEETMS